LHSRHFELLTCKQLCVAATLQVRISATFLSLFVGNCCFSLKRMQLTRTAWVESLNIRDNGWEKTYRSCQTHEFLSVYGLISTGRHLLVFFFVYNKPGIKCFLSFYT